MLRSVRDLFGARICATNGQIGSVDDVLFDDEQWAIRYILVQIDSCPSNRRTLISPRAIVAANWGGRTLYLNLRRQLVNEGPDIAIDQILSREVETQLNAYYAYPPYSNGGGLWGSTDQPYPYPYGSFSPAPQTAAPSAPMDASSASVTIRQQDEGRDVISESHLHRIRSLHDNPICAHGRTIGHVEDVLFDSKTWAIAHLVVATSDIWTGSRLLVAPNWIACADWVNPRINIALAPNAAMHSPAFECTRSNSDYETSQHRHGAPRDHWQ